MTISPHPPPWSGTRHQCSVGGREQGVRPDTSTYPAGLTVPPEHTAAVRPAPLCVLTGHTQGERRWLLGRDGRQPAGDGMGSSCERDSVQMSANYST